MPEACNFIKKETLPQLFSCEFWKISKNTFFHRTPLVAASVCSFLLIVIAYFLIFFCLKIQALTIDLFLI